jgi:argininosuccinate lyase
MSHKEMQTPTQSTDKAWSGRFSEPVSERVKRYTASIPFDWRLAPFDIQGSLAHAAMLHGAGVLSAGDLADIRRGLGEILAGFEAGDFPWTLDDEDVHFTIERALTRKVGDAGKRLHTGRSRNDQVATDIRLWLRDAIDQIQVILRTARVALLDQAEAHADTVMPGFTHLQAAQPVTFGHHLLAWHEMLVRDGERLVDCRRRVNRLPLGAAALAGTSFPIDREFVMRELGFEAVCENSLDAVSDRDFAIEFLACGALIMTHLSRMSEELVLWMTPRFGLLICRIAFAPAPASCRKRKTRMYPS